MDFGTSKLSVSCAVASPRLLRNGKQRIVINAESKTKSRNHTTAQTTPSSETNNCVEMCEVANEIDAAMTCDDWQVGEVFYEGDESAKIFQVFTLCFQITSLTGCYFHLTQNL
jgi:hypothetical protein